MPFGGQTSVLEPSHLSLGPMLPVAKPLWASTLPSVKRELQSFLSTSGGLGMGVTLALCTPVSRY